MGKQVDLDVRGLEPPEPLERVLEALSSLEVDDALHILIDREPRPLYRILDQNNYKYEAVLRNDQCYEIRIRRKT